MRSAPGTAPPLDSTRSRSRSELDHLPLRNPGAPPKGLADRTRPLLAGRRELESLDRIGRDLEYAFVAEAVAALTEERRARKRRPSPVGPRRDVVRVPAPSQLPAAVRRRSGRFCAWPWLGATSRATSARPRFARPSRYWTVSREDAGASRTEGRRQTLPLADGRGPQIRWCTPGG